MKNVNVRAYCRRPSFVLLKTAFRAVKDRLWEREMRSFAKQVFPCPVTPACFLHATAVCV